MVVVKQEEIYEKYLEVLDNLENGILPDLGCLISDIISYQYLKYINESSDSPQVDPNTNNSPVVVIREGLEPIETAVELWDDSDIDVDFEDDWEDEEPTPEPTPDPEPEEPQEEIWTLGSPLPIILS